jgi:glyoxylase-like metal-dependent hydrolase (beta-lactamase superfamily II)
MILETVVVGPMQVNCYILAAGEDSEAIIIDPGAEEHKIRRILERYALSPVFVLNTHGHYDHIGCDDKFSLPVYVHRKDALLLREPQMNLSSLFALPYRVTSPILLLEDNAIVSCQGLELRVLHVPGHTPGGVAFYLIKPKRHIVFSGDSLFCQGIGRTDFPGADEALLVRGIKERLLSLSDDTIVYPGHGQPSTIGEEKASNPFLR